ncbi:hypothetical protein B0H17DRAFT_1151570 [Mycena rosella]|uniref:Uncharacterized protein n=1 Tax=Mycena rosella TaxID=1033263 RepID=A0AAD7FJN3_MYCRO|nr:hypothetical protein B0H17DRAFT_1151570 [Mycena rosella]
MAQNPHQSFLPRYSPEARDEERIGGPRGWNTVASELAGASDGFGSKNASRFALQRGKGARAARARRARSSSGGARAYTPVMGQEATSDMAADGRLYKTHSGFPPARSYILCEATEQLNSWLSGFESQLRQMSDVNYDFFVHALMMIYAEKVEKHVVEKDLALPDDFWAQALGN